MTKLFGAIALLLAAVAPHAGAAEPAAPTGFACGFAATADPERADWWVGEVDGGPLTVPGSERVTLRCSIQLGWLTHDAPDLVSVSASGDGSAGVAVVPPTVFRYTDPHDDVVAVCSEVTVVEAGGATRTLYRDHHSGDWTTDPRSTCDFMSTVCPTTTRGHDYCRDPFEPDSTLCPVLATAFPPEGDVPGLWDCPPYQGSATRATPGEPAVAGAPCRAERPTGPQGPYALELSGGPVTVSTAAGADGVAAVTLRCSLQYDATHADPDAASAAATGAGVAVLPPTVVVVPGDTPPGYLCTEVTFATPGADPVTRYLDGTTHEWTADPAAPCHDEAPACVQRSHLDCVNPADPFGTVVDPVLCRVLERVLPPDGDVPPVYDCPPYGS